MVEGPGDIRKQAFGILPRQKFRPSKQDANIFVQRRPFRIKTGGEKREITYKGLEVLRAKGRKKKGFSIF